MKEFIITLAFIILAVFLVNTFILGGEGTIEYEGKRIGEEMIEDLQTISGN